MNASNTKQFFYYSFCAWIITCSTFSLQCQCDNIKNNEKPPKKTAASTGASATTELDSQVKNSNADKDAQLAEVSTLDEASKNNKDPQPDEVSDPNKAPIPDEASGDKQGPTSGETPKPDEDKKTSKWVTDPMIDKARKDGWSFLAKLLEDLQVDATKVAINQTNPADGNKTALHYAAELGSADILEALIKHNAQSQWDSAHKTPLDRIAQRIIDNPTENIPRYKDAIRVLLNAQHQIADPDTTKELLKIFVKNSSLSDEVGKLLLKQANNPVDIIAEVLESCINQDTKASQLDTIFAHFSDEEKLKILKKAFNKLYPAVNSGWNLVTVDNLLKQVPPSKYQAMEGTLKYLVEALILSDQNQTSSNELAKVIFDSNIVQLDVKLTNGLTPVHLAAKEKRLAMLKFLVEEKKADLRNLKHGMTGETVLATAIKYYAGAGDDYQSIIQYLLKQDLSLLVRSADYDKFEFTIKVGYKFSLANRRISGATMYKITWNKLESWIREAIKERVLPTIQANLNQEQVKENIKLNINNKINPLKDYPYTHLRKWFKDFEKDFLEKETKNMLYNGIPTNIQQKKEVILIKDFVRDAIQEAYEEQLIQKVEEISKNP